MKKLVVVEGSDKSGKSTFITNLLEYLSSYEEWTSIHNPSGNDCFSNDLYELIQKASDETVKNYLILASHAYNIRQVNNMLKEENVVMDRSLVSCYIYNFYNHYNSEQDFYNSICWDGGIDKIEADKIWYIQLMYNKDFDQVSNDALDHYFYENKSAILKRYEESGAVLANLLFSPNVAICDNVENIDIEQLRNNILGVNYESNNY